MTEKLSAWIELVQLWQDAKSKADFAQDALDAAMLKHIQLTGSCPSQSRFDEVEDLWLAESHRRRALDGFIQQHCNISLLETA